VLLGCSGFRFIWASLNAAGSFITSVSPSSSVSGSNLMSPSNHLFSGPTPIVRKLFSGSSPLGGAAA